MAFIFLFSLSSPGGWAPVRLSGNHGSCAGRVELFYQGVWGTVCDDLWDLTEANIICRQLGCGRAVSALSEAYFGQGSGKILLDNVHCKGHEEHLEECSHLGWFSHNCDHSEDASVICSGEAHCPLGPSFRPPRRTPFTPVSITVLPTVAKYQQKWMEERVCFSSQLKDRFHHGGASGSELVSLLVQSQVRWGWCLLSTPVLFSLGFIRL